LSYKSRIAKTNEFAIFNMPVLNIQGQIDDAKSDRRSVEEIEREAYEKGFEQGEKAGFDMGERKAAVLIERLENVLKELVLLKKKTLEETEPQLIELSVGIAKKIILKELALDPDQIVEITKEALKKIERTGQIFIKMNSSVRDLFVKHKPELLSIHPDIVFDIDPSAPLQGSVVMSPVEDVITDVDERLRDLIKDMGNRLGRD